jgi:sugar phosphate isomerase/epimerase
MSRIRKYAKIGMVHFMAFPQVMKDESLVPETLAKILGDDYFEAVEVTRIKEKSVARTVARMIGASGTTVAFGAQPVLLGGRLNLNDLNDKARLKAVQAVKECFEQAAELKALAVAVLAGPWNPSCVRQAQDALAASLIELSHEAEKFRLKLVLEIFDDAVDKKALVGKAPVACLVGDRVRAECPNFGLMHDLSHLPLLGETPAQALTPIKHLLVHAHIGNAVIKNTSHFAYGDQHPRFGIPAGENDVPQVREFLKTLQEIGYFDPAKRPILSFEIKPGPGEDSEVIIEEAKRVLNEAALFLA